MLEASEHDRGERVQDDVAEHRCEPEHVSALLERHGRGFPDRESWERALLAGHPTLLLRVVDILAAGAVDTDLTVRCERDTQGWSPCDPHL